MGNRRDWRLVVIVLALLIQAARPVVEAVLEDNPAASSAPIEGASPHELFTEPQGGHGEHVAAPATETFAAAGGFVHQVKAHAAGTSGATAAATKIDASGRADG